MAVVRLEALRKVYANGQVAVAGATFTAAHSERLVLVGPSGCGKSTLLRMIAGLEDITSGTLAIGDRIVNEVSPRDRDVAMVFQSYALYPHMSVSENLGFGLKLRGVARAEIAARVSEAAALLDLAALLERRPAQLSGGQRQRVALGRALVRKPSVFLLDEPLSNLDAKLRMSMRVEIARLHRRLDTTMIYVTHDQVEAMTLGDRIVVLNQGVIEQIDTPMRLYDHPATMFVAGFLGSPAMNFFRGRLTGPIRGNRALDLGAERLPMPGASEIASALPEGKELIVGIRPEAFTLADAATLPTLARIDAVLDLVEPVGNEMFLNLRFGDAAIVARIVPHELPPTGTIVTLAYDPARAHLFDADSTANCTATSPLAATPPPAPGIAVDHSSR